MSIRYKINILEHLKSAGFNTNRIRKEKLLSESTLQYLRNGKIISIDAIDRICTILNCQPSDLIYYESDSEYTSSDVS